MRVKAQRVAAGLHPNEVIVEVKTTTGTERLVVDKRAFQDNSISVGSPIGMSEQGEYLVELPRETTTGAWRVWVASEVLSKDKVGKAA